MYSEALKLKEEQRKKQAKKKYKCLISFSVTLKWSHPRTKLKLLGIISSATRCTIYLQVNDLTCLG